MEAPVIVGWIVIGAELCLLVLLFAGENIFHSLPRMKVFNREHDELKGLVLDRLFLNKDCFDDFCRNQIHNFVSQPLNAPSRFRTIADAVDLVALKAKSVRKIIAALRAWSALAIVAFFIYLGYWLLTNSWKLSQKFVEDLGGSPLSLISAFEIAAFCLITLRLIVEYVDIRRLTSEA